MQDKTHTTPSFYYNYIFIYYYKKYNFYKNLPNKYPLSHSVHPPTPVEHFKHPVVQGTHGPGGETTYSVSVQRVQSLLVPGD